MTITLLVAFSLLLKPVTLAVCVPVGLCVLLRAERRWRNLAVLVVVTAVAIAVPTVLIGFSADGETNASLRRADSVEDITPERATELLAERRAKTAG